MSKKVQAMIVIAAVFGCFVWSNAIAKSATAPAEVKQPQIICFLYVVG